MAKKKKEERKMNADWVTGPDGKGWIAPTEGVLPGMEEVAVETLETSEAGVVQQLHRLLGGLTQHDREKLMLMIDLAVHGVNPTEYADFYRIFQLTGELAETMYDDDDEDDDDLYEGEEESDDDQFSDKYSREYVEEASGKTLVLKIQMKGVVKPPMWREVRVAADTNFLHLHEIIQTVVGLEQSHLWEFSKEDNDETVRIGILADEEFGPGLDEVTHDAEETILYDFFREQSDRMEYVYDFGDNWVFTVTVKEVLPEKCAKPECTAIKSDLNAMEDVGGPYNYMEMRTNLTLWDSMSPHMRKKAAIERGFDSAKEYRTFLEDHLFDKTYVNEALAQWF